LCLPRGNSSSCSPSFERLLSKACVTPVFVADAQYRLFTWSRRDGVGCGLSPLPSTDPPSCLFAQHRILLASFGGIVERSNEPDWWIANHNDALTESVAQTDGTFLKYWAWAFEEKPIPIDMERFYVIAEEVNANRTLCHRLSGEIVLFAHDHLFDHVKRYPGWRENTLYRLRAARYFREWVNAVAFLLPALGRPKTEIARLLGVSRRTLYDLIEEKQPVTPVMALRLGKLCGNGPDLWLNLQKRYDLERAAREFGEKIKAIPTLEVV
jgi:antitoxin HigA-1